jgi:hypothetical protein
VQPACVRMQGTTGAPLGAELISMDSPFAAEGASACLDSSAPKGVTFRGAGQKVLAGHAAAKSFRTLRDLKVDW